MSPGYLAEIHPASSVLAETRPVFTYCLFQYRKMFFTDYSDVYTEARVLCTIALHVGNLCPLHVLIKVTLSIHNDVLHLGRGEHVYQGTHTARTQK